MADYYAVLNRTLSGFTDPKPQLRSKLYERARGTIRRQLEGRTPPLDPAMLEGELQKLEDAIVAIESSYTSDGAPPDEAAPREPPADTPAPADPAGPQEDMVEVVNSPQPEVEAPAVEEPEPPTATEPAQGSKPAPPVDEPLDPVDAWASEFGAIQNDDSATQPADDKPAVATPAAEIAAPVAEAATPPAPEGKAAPEPAPAPLDVPSFDPKASEELMIPPAAASAAGKDGKGGLGRWILLLFVVIVLGAAGTYGLMHRQALLETVGLDHLIDDPTRPKPVKTITIKPEPEPEPEPEAEAEPPVSEPKLEQRLTEDGEEVSPTAEPTVTPVLPTVQPDDASPDTGEIAPVEAGAAPVVSQSAILYEEGATRDKNTLDSGRVVWSVVQEANAETGENEPAIRARVEIPGRSVVLIMTIKRNADKALPASHLIELVFAVPDDFSGGAIDAINRYVLKETEQGQGAALVGVPARIADGIFLIALNNLEETKTRNVTLLRERDWIDIPMQYRTGRRALMTIEKGVPGEKVFKDVFEAWDKLEPAAN